jgi:hypothetical protein
MTTRRILSALSAAGIAGLILLGSPAANAAELDLTDPARDNDGPGLDIVDADLANNDSRMNITLDYRVNRSGVTIVGLKARERSTIRVIDKHRADGSGQTFLLNAKNKAISCSGLRSDWDAEDVELTLSVPSTCLWSGNYGAVRPWFLTEPIGSGSDIDFLETKQWIARG